MTASDIERATRRLGLSGRPLCVHASLRSFGWVEGGAAAVVDGLLAAGCTVMFPAFSWGFAVPPGEARPARNGWDYDAFAGSTAGMGRVYTPDTDEIDAADMGAIAVEVLGRSGRARGDHPLCSFAAVGPLGRQLISAQAPLDVWAPLRALVGAGGSVVLMGVGLIRLTLLHLAEEMAGRTPFIRWANGPDLRPMQVQAGGCSHGFEAFEAALSGTMEAARVGESNWRVLPAKGALEAAAEAIRRDPMLTHCGNTECGRCADAVAGGPVLEN